MRQAIARTGLDDFVDLLMALARFDLDLPKPPTRPSASPTGSDRAPFLSRVCAAMPVEVAIIVADARRS
jgi:hypothetical protein